MAKNLLLIFLCAVLVGAKAQSVSFTNNVGGAIPDAGPYTYFSIVVNDPRLDSMNSHFGFEHIQLSVTHTYDADLEAQLMAPDGSIIPLFTNIGGGGHNFTDTELFDSCSTSIDAGSSPFTGLYRPEGSLYLLNNNHTGNGTWYLIMRDDAAVDTGSVHYVTLTFSAAPALPPPPITSNIPIVKIYTDSSSPIVDNPRIGAWMKIIDHGPGIRNGQNDTNLAFNGRIAIEIRGSSSQSFPKKSYGFETTDMAGNEIDTSFLGFPSQSDWIFNAHYTDKTLFRNNLSYDLARDMGQYASRVRFVEIFVNDEYLGVYVAMEKIKRDSNRVDISKLKTSDTTGSNVTGGYILKIDKFTGAGGLGWYSGVPCTNSGGSIYPFIQYEYPSDADIQPQQATYIQSYMDSFEAALNGPNYQDTALGFRKYAAEKTFIDYEIIDEISKDVDGYRLSTYFYKEKSTHGGKLKMGPVWDYDIAYDNANYCEGNVDTGWAYDYNYVCGPAAVPFWWEKLMTDSVYTRKLYCRYNSLRTKGPLRFDSLFNYIDSNAALLNESQQRNFIKWPILGTYVWPNPSPIPADYPGEIQNLKNWLTGRLTWLDSAIGAYATAYPTITMLHDTTICQGQSVLLDAGSGYKYDWSDSLGSKTQTLLVTQAGTYTVTATTTYDCPASAQSTIHVIALPNAQFTKAVTDSNNYTFTAATGQGSYQWQYGDGTSAATAAGAHHYDSTGTYTITLTVTDSLGCQSIYTDTINVKALVPVVQPNGIAAISADALRVYPNPASSIVYVETGSSTQLNVYAILGEKLISKTLPRGVNAIDISSLPQGVYMFAMRNSAGSHVVKWTKE